MSATASCVRRKPFSAAHCFSHVVFCVKSSVVFLIVLSVRFLFFFVVVVRLCSVCLIKFAHFVCLNVEDFISHVLLV